MKFSPRLDFSRLSGSRLARLGPLVAWAIALAIAAWVAVDLFWRFATPRPPALPVATEADPQRAAQAIASRHLLGQGAAPGAQNITAAPSRYSLQAVVTGADGRPGWAVLTIDGGPQQGFVEGQDIRPGLQLARVLPDSVELLASGARQRVMLAERPGAGAGSAPPPAMPGNTTPPTPSPVEQPVISLPSPPGHSEVQASDATQQPSQAGFIPSFQPQPNPANQ